MADFTSSIARHGFAIVPNLVDHATIDELVDQTQGLVRPQASGHRSGGSRDLFRIPLCQTVAQSQPIRSHIEAALGSTARVIRGIFFDKTPGANWKVAWHQDVTIALREQVELPGYTAWSLKAGTVHVQPPACVLTQMLTARVHLDDTDASNGALRVLPCTHTSGKLSPAELQRCITNVTPVTCKARAGDVLFMQPLLVHASSAALTPNHRRVIHLDYCAAQLPPDLEWAL